MKNEDEPILEAEVVEIDGVAVEPHPEPNTPEPKNARRVDWQSWQGKIRVLDKRWAPLWILLGIVALVLIVVFGFLFAILALIYWFVKSILRGVFSIFSTQNHTLNRRS